MEILSVPYSPVTLMGGFNGAEAEVVVTCLMCGALVLNSASPVDGLGRSAKALHSAWHRA